MDSIADVLELRSEQYLNGSITAQDYITAVMWAMNSATQPKLAAFAKWVSNHGTRTANEKGLQS